MTLINIFFYANGALALATTFLALSARNAVHALLYFVLSIISLAIGFYMLDAPLASALEVMVYAGAIMVLFVFVVMLLNIKFHERAGPLKKYVGPLICAVILLVELALIISQSVIETPSTKTISPKEIAISLFNNYGLGIEIASLILLGGLIGAFHIGKKRSVPQ